MSSPHRVSRLVSLSLSFAFGVIGFGIGINALVKSNQSEKQLRASVPKGATVNINTDDVLKSGIALTVASGLLALTSLFAFPSVLLSSASLTGARLLRVQGALLAFFTVFLFAALTPFTDFVANRQAKVTAFFGAIPVPAATIQAIEAGLGATPIYKDIGYLKNTAILPWFAFLFGTTSAVLTFLAARRTSVAPATTGFSQDLNGSPSTGYDDEKKHPDGAASTQV